LNQQKKHKNSIKIYFVQLTSMLQHQNQVHKLSFIVASHCIKNLKKEENLAVTLLLENMMANKTQKSAIKGTFRPQKLELIKTKRYSYYQALMDMKTRKRKEYTEK